MEKEYSWRADQKRNAKAAVVAEQKAKLTDPEKPELQTCGKILARPRGVEPLLQD